MNKKVKLLFLVVLMMNGISAQSLPTGTTNWAPAIKNSPKVIQQRIVTQEMENTFVPRLPFQSRMTTGAKPNLETGKLTLSKISRSTTSSDSATLRLTVGNIWGDSTGYILCIGEFDGVIDINILFENTVYSIPENVTNDFSTPVLVDASETVTIPGGNYDIEILNIVPEWTTYYTAYGFYGSVRNITFQNGWVYEFEVIFDPNHGDFVDHTFYCDSIGATPDLSIDQLLSPSTGCNFSASEHFTIVVSNSANVASSTPYTINYSLNGVSGSQSIASVLPPKSTITIQIAEDFNLSAADNYVFSVNISDPADLYEVDNASGTSLFSGPLSIPFINLLESEDDAGQFYCDGNSWVFVNSPEYGRQDYAALEVGMPLYSHCISMLPGNYKLKFSYFAGNWYYNDTDDFDVYVGKAGTDIATWTLICSFRNADTNDEYVLSETNFTIQEADDYQIAFIPIRITGLCIESVEITAISGIDKIEDSHIIAYYYNDNLTIKSENMIKTIVINDVKGSVVSSVTGLNSNNYTINLSNIAKGIYFARIQTINEIKVAKFVVY